MPARRRSSTPCTWRSTRSRRTTSRTGRPIDEVVQREPAGASDPEFMGQLAAVGIRQGRAVRARRADARDPRGGGRASATPPPAPLTFAPRESEGMAYYPGSAWFNMLWVGGYEFLDAAAEITADGVSRARATARASSTRESLLLHGHRDHTRDVHAAHRHGLAVPRRLRDADGEYFDGARDYRLNAAGRRSREPLLVGDGVRPPDALDAAERSAVPQPRQSVRHGRDRTPTARPTSTSDPRRRAERSTTGSRPSPARAGSRSFASTARCSRSSTRAGGRARSSPSASQPQNVNRKEHHG